LIAIYLPASAAIGRLFAFQLSAELAESFHFLWMHTAAVAD